MIESGGASASLSERKDPVRDSATSKFEFSGPTADDAGAIADLIASCPPLDPNSLYCNLLQCTHFAGTCIKAERDGVLEGWISGYRPPDDPEAIFVWQVAVHERARGLGLGVAMLEALLQRPGAAGARRLITTVTPSNQASRRMFVAFARSRNARVDMREHFDRERHFAGRHESEELISIEPL